jgi:2-polyprenyl-6-methoxyphenol hydroxylase-like FAD-dependent oxidoreductase
MNPGSSDVLIVGAGPTGLTLAIWLVRLGVGVRIIDKNPGPAAFSRALGVQARTLEFDRQLGFGDEIVERGVTVPGLNLWVKGAKAARVPLSGIGEGMTPYPFVLVNPQDEHERLLIERLEALGVRVDRETELVTFKQEPTSVRATLRTAEGDVTHTAAYIAGCDGTHSVVRELIAAGFPGGTYTGLFYVADVEAGGPVIDQELHVDLDEADLLLVFPMKGDGRVRLVGTVRGDVATRDRLTFENVSSRAIEHLKIGVTKVNWFSDYRVHHRVASRFRKARAFLLGDAAHVHSPVGAQGMNTGIGDAVNLAWKIAAVVKGRASENILDTYEIERRAFARRLVATTDQIFTLATRDGSFARGVRTRVFPLVASILFRLPAMRRFVFRTASQLGVRYGMSDLSAGKAGSVRGGDRLPWVRLARNGDDNFVPLRSLQWQVHVYGDSRTGVAEACKSLGLAMHAFAWVPKMKQAGFMRGALYLVRPDGYVALADPRSDPERLRGYFRERDLRAAS